MNWTSSCVGVGALDSLRSICTLSGCRATLGAGFVPENQRYMFMKLHKSSRNSFRNRNLARSAERSSSSSSSSLPFSSSSSVTSMDPMSDRSDMVNNEIVLFLFQLEMDAALQRALTYEDFETAKKVRARRAAVDEALRDLQEHKGYGCGARCAAQSSQIEYAPEALLIRAKMAEAVEQERYDDAARLRDELDELEARAAEAELPCPVTEPRFSLGQMVVHCKKGYRGVIAGWDNVCCESTEWQRKAGVDELAGGVEQVFYHVLIDVNDWPGDEFESPVAYIPEEVLSSISLADFASDEPLVDFSFTHPYAYLMFLGSTGGGNMIPCRQLREK